MMSRSMVVVPWYIKSLGHYYKTLHRIRCDLLNAGGAVWSLVDTGGGPLGVCGVGVVLARLSPLCFRRCRLCN